MDSSESRSRLSLAIRAALLAGREILDVYGSEFAVEHKDDRSPLTLADQRAHAVIAKRLAASDLPVLSEEGREIDYEERRAWPEFWMVDPLDGTKEFVKRNGEFTVNIALIRGQSPVAGVIWVPVKHTLYFAAQGLGAYRIVGDAALDPECADDLEALMAQAEKLPVDRTGSNYVVVASRSHLSPETQARIDEVRAQHGEVDIRSLGSSLKICLVAEGEADEYPRYAPTMEWDTAAGQAIAECAGKRVLQYGSDQPVVYNKPDLLNPWFLVCSGSSE